MKHLKIKKFNIQAKPKEFESVKYMTDSEKAKIYKNFVSFLNNHFSFSTFKKNLYEHFHLHCGFIAHYNIYGFYGEYFGTAALFHCNVMNYDTPMHECMGNLNRKSYKAHSELFYAIYEEMNGRREGIGEFMDVLLHNRHYGSYSDYKDLDDAMQEAISEYFEMWRDLIRDAIRTQNKISHNEEIMEIKKEQEALKAKFNELEQKAEQLIIKEEVVVAKVKEKLTIAKKQPNLFDFMECA